MKAWRVRLHYYMVEISKHIRQRMVKGFISHLVLASSLLNYIEVALTYAYRPRRIQICDLY